MSTAAPTRDRTRHADARRWSIPLDRERWRSRIRWFAAEFLVVVLGVLAALAGAAWSQRRGDRQRETEYLQRFVAEFVSDSTTLSADAAGYGRKLAALAATAPVVHGGEPVPADTFAFIRNVGLGGVYGLTPRLEVTRAAYEELLSTGQLRLIHDVRLRESLVRYYRSADDEQNRIDRRRSGYVLFVHGLYPAEERDSLRMDDIRSNDLKRILARVRSEEFRSLHLQETNLGLFMRQVVRSQLAEKGRMLREVREGLARQ